jgi:hypothetical protein
VRDAVRGHHGAADAVHLAREHHRCTHPRLDATPVLGDTTRVVADVERDVEPGPGTLRAATGPAGEAREDAGTELGGEARKVRDDHPFRRDGPR